jgi:hypothetical protein
VCEVIIIIIIIIICVTHHKKLGRAQIKTKKNKKETTEIKTHFDKYKQGTNRNDQRWKDF